MGLSLPKFTCHDLTKVFRLCLQHIMDMQSLSRYCYNMVETPTASTTVGRVH